MRTLTTLFRAIAGLFIDDGWLALAIGIVVAVAAVVAAIAPAVPMAAGVVLLVGCPALLFGNVTRAANRGIRSTTFVAASGESAVMDPGATSTSAARNQGGNASCRLGCNDSPPRIVLP